MTSSTILLENPALSTEKQKFGTIIGVYIPSILMLFGVIIFLRLGWIVGSAGLYPTLFIITLGTAITFITILSLSAAATNTQVGKGGAYYMISRALGLELGSAIGLPLFFKQSLSISFCIVGFADSFQTVFPQFPITSVSIITLILLTAFTSISTNFALKIQLFIFGVIVASLYSLFSGDASAVESSQGLVSNSINSPTPFWTIFAIFFPAMTGLESTVSLSGDLKNPSRSLPLGIIAALFTAYAIYMAIPIFLWSQVSQEQLITNPLIIQQVAKYESLIVLGIWGATLSSALGGLLGAPRTLQALAEDGIVPRFLAKEYGRFQEPRLSTAITVVLAFIGIGLGSIDVIAQLLTMICLISYMILNLATGLEDLMANPSWRPSIPLHWSISFIGAGLCLLAMLMINSGAAILAILGIGCIYIFFKKKGVSTRWDDIRYGILMFFSRFALYRLDWQKPSSRSWRPNFLVFTEHPSEVSNEILNFAKAITQSKGFLTVASILPKNRIEEHQLQNLHEKIKTLLKEFEIEAMLSLNQAHSFSSGMKQVILHYGLGPLTPNTVVCGGISQEEKLVDYLEVIKLAHEKGKNVVIINDEKKMNLSNVFSQEKIKGDIYVWWDDQNPRNTELMLVLAYMLCKNPLWKKTTISLMSVVSHETMRQQRLEELETMIKHNRFQIKTSVLVGENLAQNLDFIKNFSLEAAIIFLSLRPPLPEETLENYSKYFQTLPHKSADFPPVALVMSTTRALLQEVVQIDGLNDQQIEKCL